MGPWWNTRRFIIQIMGVLLAISRRMERENTRKLYQFVRFQSQEPLYYRIQTGCLLSFNCYAVSRNGQTIFFGEEWMLSLLLFARFFFSS